MLQKILYFNTPKTEVAFSVWQPHGPPLTLDFGLLFPLNFTPFRCSDTAEESSWFLIGSKLSFSDQCAAKKLKNWCRILKTLTRLWWSSLLPSVFSLLAEGHAWFFLKTTFRCQEIQRGWYSRKESLPLLLCFSSHAHGFSRKKKKRWHTVCSVGGSSGFLTAREKFNVASPHLHRSLFPLSRLGSNCRKGQLTNSQTLMVGHTWGEFHVANKLCSGRECYGNLRIFPQDPHTDLPSKWNTNSAQKEMLGRGCRVICTWSWY